MELLKMKLSENKKFKEVALCHSQQLISKPFAVTKTTFHCLPTQNIYIYFSFPLSLGLLLGISNILF